VSSPNTSFPVPSLFRLLLVYNSKRRHSTNGLAATLRKGVHLALVQHSVPFLDFWPGARIWQKSGGKRPSVTPFQH